MSDLVKELRRARVEEFAEFRDRDAEFRRLKERAYAASNALFALPTGSSRARRTSLNAKCRTLAQARERREDELRVAWEAARRIDWPREKCWVGSTGMSEAQR